jgi:hypothetical protein
MMVEFIYGKNSEKETRMFEYNLAKRIISETPELIDALQKDLEIAKEQLSEESVRLIESGIYNHKARVAQAELSLKFLDYQ